MSNEFVDRYSAEGVAKINAETATHSAVIKVRPPDYADIQRLENMTWEKFVLMPNYQAYAHEYHQLAVKFTEDVVIYCIEQFHRGVRW